MVKMPAARTESIQQWKSTHTLDFLFANALPSVIGSFAVVLTLACTLAFQPVALIFLIIWTVLGGFIAFSRLALSWGFSKKQNRRSPAFWLNGYRGLTFSSGLLNGFGVWLFFDHVSPAHQLLILFSVVGLTAAAAATHSVDQVTFNSFMYPSCILATAKITFYGGSTYYALALMFLFYIFVMGRAGRQTNETLQHNFELTYAMHYRATHDPLVGLLNREEFENQFDVHARQTRHGVAIVFIDLDNFKQLNDTFGHQAGDEALKKVSSIITKHIRADDVCARLGGDEFVIFLLLNDIKELERIAHNIIREVRALTFPGEHNFAGLSASIGIAFHHNNQVIFSKLMRIADMACYKSKEAGKNQMTLLRAEEGFS